MSSYILSVSCAFVLKNDPRFPGKSHAIYSSLLLKRSFSFLSHSSPLSPSFSFVKLEETTVVFQGSLFFLSFSRLTFVALNLTHVFVFLSPSHLMESTLGDDKSAVDEHELSGGRDQCELETRHIADRGGRQDAEDESIRKYRVVLVVDAVVERTLVDILLRKV